MKTKLFALLATMLCASALSAQVIEREVVNIVTVKENTDTLTISSGAKRVVIVERNDDGRRTEISYYNDKNRNHRVNRIRNGGMIDLGVNVYGERNIFNGNSSDGFREFPDQNTSKSVGFAIYPWMGRLGLNRSNSLVLTSGIGIDWGNYRFSNGWTIRNVAGYTLPSDKYNEADKDVKKSKLTTVYLNVPLMMRVNLPAEKSNSVYVAAGVIGGVKIGSHTKAKFYGGSKDKVRDSFNLNTLRYQLTARAGYGNVGLFFNYQMTPMFEKGHGAELYPYIVGFSFGF